MVKTYSIAEARDHLASVVHEAESGAQVELTRRGKPVAMLIGVEDFERRQAKAKSGFREAYEKFLREHNLAELDIDPDEIFGDMRDPSPGRDFNW
jgi:antitoxin Phd